jgi:hypothetical protein
VHGEDVLADVGQHRERHGAPADVGAGPALDRHGAAHQQRAVVIGLGAGVEHAIVHGGADVLGKLQPPVDGAPGPVGADPAGVGAPAEEQAEAGHDHGLARAGLAGDDRQARPEGKGGVVDNAQSGDAELLQHAPDTSRAV